MWLTLGTDNIISPESYKKLVNISQRDRENLGSVSIHITLIMVIGHSLDSTADCVCFQRCCLALRREVEPNNVQVCNLTKTFHTGRGRMSPFLQRAFPRPLPRLTLLATDSLNGRLHGWEPL